MDSFPAGGTAVLTFTVPVSAVLLLEIIHRRQEKLSFRDVISRWAAWRWLLYYTSVVLVLVLAGSGRGSSSTSSFRG